MLYFALGFSESIFRRIYQGCKLIEKKRRKKIKGCMIVTVLEYVSRDDISV